jgi:hypothetical protein
VRLPLTRLRNAHAAHSAPPLPPPPRALSRLARVLTHDFFRGAPRAAARTPHGRRRSARWAGLGGAACA